MVDMKMQDKMQLGQANHMERVSELMDGRLRGSEFDAALQVVGSDEGRDTWHLYHMIGDVLRSSELAACQRDTGFVEKLSERLKQERPLLDLPVSQVPPAVEVIRADRPAANDGTFRWKLVAGVASFAAVAAMGWGALGGLGPQPAGSQMAQSAVSSGAQNARSDRSTLAVVELPRGEGDVQQTMLRDPRLDELLLEHRQAAGASALRDASGFLRNATFEGSGR